MQENGITEVFILDTRETALLAVPERDNFFPFADAETLLGRIGTAHFALLGEVLEDGVLDRTHPVVAAKIEDLQHMALMCAQVMPHVDESVSLFAEDYLADATRALG